MSLYTSIHRESEKGYSRQPGLPYVGLSETHILINALESHQSNSPNSPHGPMIQAATSNHMSAHWAGSGIPRNPLAARWGLHRRPFPPLVATGCAISPSLERTTLLITSAGERRNINLY